MSDLLREIDEDVAREKSEQFLEKWGLSIGVFLVILIGGLFFYFQWDQRRANTALDEADRFDQVTELLISNPADASAVLTDLSGSSSGFGDLAQFRLGDALWIEGESEAAVEAWRAYVTDPTGNTYLQNLTRMKMIWFAAGALPEEETQTYLSTLEAREAYRAYVPVLRAVVALEQGNSQEALELLEEVSGKEDAGPVRDMADALASLVRTL